MSTTTIVGQVSVNQDCHVQLHCSIFQISRLEKETAAFKRRLEDIDTQLKSVTNEPERFEIRNDDILSCLSLFTGEY